MASFCMFAGDKARKKREYARKLVEVEARLRAAYEQREAAKDDVRRIECAIKVKLAEYDNATGVMKKQLGHELHIEREKLAGIENRFNVQNTSIMTLERVKSKTQELLDLLDRPGLEGDIPQLVGALEKEYAGLAVGADLGGELAGVGFDGFMDVEEPAVDGMFDELHAEVFGAGARRKRADTGLNDLTGWDDRPDIDVSDEMAQLQREIDEGK